MDVKCMCGYTRERGSCTVIRLTAEEQKQLPEPVAEIYYCPPCLRVIQDPEQGPKLMRGVREQMLLASGVPKKRAAELADDFYEGLKKKTPK